jgi:hypothetical protein
VPATQEDAEIIDAYHGLLNGPAYGSSLIPVLRVGGEVVARGRTAVSTGYTQKLSIAYRSPGFATTVVDNPLSVGSLSALSLDLGAVDAKSVTARGAQLAEQIRATPDQPTLTDARAGELFDQLGDLYFLKNDGINEVLAQSLGVATQRQLSGAIVATDVNVSYLAGFPIATRLGGTSFDVDQDVLSATRLDASTPDAIGRFMRASGAFASHAESGVLASTFGGEAASTTTVLHAAMTEQIPIYVIDGSNLDAALAKVTAPASAKAEIRRAVTERNAMVTIPERAVTVGDWTGTGWIVEGATGSEYKIQGGANGGSSSGSAGDSESAAKAAEHSGFLAHDCDHLWEHRLFEIFDTILLFTAFFQALFWFAFPANILFLALWVVELVIWYVLLWRYLELEVECQNEE